MLEKPHPSEYHEFYETYISKTAHVDNIIDSLEEQRKEVIEAFRDIPVEKQQYKYGEGKWTVMEVLRHIIDTESLFAYRAFTISKNTGANLAGMDQNEYMDGTDDSQNSFDDLIREFNLQRQSNVMMIKNLHDGTYGIIGNANGTPVSVRANIYIVFGHTAHHMEILRERYL